MVIKLLLFAGIAEALGSSELSYDTASSSITAAELIISLGIAYPSAAERLHACFVAVNQAYASPHTIINAGDEVALIPPVSGGENNDRSLASHSLTTNYQVTYEAISVDTVTNQVIEPAHGAVLTFTGTTREWTHGKRTILLEYEGYIPMVLKTMKQIGDECSAKWPGTRCAITHRLGQVGIGEISVVIAVSTAHRGECYEASRYSIERLKQIVPIWKKEVWEDGSEWKGHQQGPWNPLTD